MTPKPYILDMETSDPDDFLTLLLLLGHPEVDLQAVTITPGTREQVHVVRQALSWFNKDIAVGAFNIDHVGECVSAWHYKAFPRLKKLLAGRPDLPPPPDEAEPGWEVLDRMLGPETTLVCGAALKNLGELFRHRSEHHYDEKPCLGRAFIQGGFAGEGVVPPERQLEKFRGKVTCPTFNLNGDPASALVLLHRRKWFSELKFVSKNVCHGVRYDSAMHVRFGALRSSWCGHMHSDRCDCPCHEPDSGIMHVMACCVPCPLCGEMVPGAYGMGAYWPGLTPLAKSQFLIYQGMSHYLGRHKDGKAFHDPLAACCAINPSIGTWASVELYREQGEWGSFLMPTSGVRIITGYDHERFVRTLLGEKSDVFSNAMLGSVEGHADHLGIHTEDVQEGDKICIGAAILSHAQGEFLSDLIELPPPKN